MLEILFLLFVAHAVCDYPLQGDWLSKAKNPTLNLVPNEIIWPGALGAHALIHAGAVFLITSMPLLALLEFVAHFAIDYLKCKKWFGYNTDQALHILCKVIWVAILALV